MVAKIAEVRVELVSRQRAWAQAHGGGVLEGRNIASVVFPDAATLGKMAVEKGDFVSGERLEPIYLREASFVKAPLPRVIAGS